MAEVGRMLARSLVLLAGFCSPSARATPTVASTSEPQALPDYLLDFRPPYSPGDLRPGVELWVSRCDLLGTRSSMASDVCGVRHEIATWRTAPFGAHFPHTARYDAIWLQDRVLAIADSGQYRLLDAASGEERGRGSLDAATQTPRCAVGPNSVYVRLTSGEGRVLTLVEDELKAEPTNEAPTCRFRADAAPRRPEDAVAEGILRGAYARPLDRGLKQHP